MELVLVLANPSDMDGTSLPDVISTASQPEWTRDVEQFDVVVVGFGISGGCAALEAARCGGRVVLLERAAIHGGTSSMSGGAFSLGGGTPVQNATGHADQVGAMRSEGRRGGE